MKRALSMLKCLIKSFQHVKKIGTGKTDMRITSVLRKTEGVAKNLADNDHTIVLFYKGREVLKLGKNARPGLAAFIAEHVEIVDEVKATKILTEILL